MRFCFTREKGRKPGGTGRCLRVGEVGDLGPGSGENLTGLGEEGI